MKNFLLHRALFFFAGLLFVFVGSSCVKDGSVPCDNTLRIVYDYNMSRVDTFEKQVEFLSIFVFDSVTGLFHAEYKFQGPFDGGFEWTVPEDLYGADYDYLVWAGLDSDSYAFTSPEKGVTGLEEFRVQVKGYADQFVGRDLEPLWHGIIRDVRFTINDEKTEVISLMKDTNTFRLVFSFVEEGEIVYPYDVNDLETSIYSADGWYNQDNTVLDPVDRPIRYLSYHGANDVNAGLVYELNTLRLMNERETTLVLKKKEGEEIFRMPLNYYLNLLRLTEEIWITNQQEYLDREDNFRIVIFMSNDGGGEDSWASFRITINDWVVREHGIG